MGLRTDALVAALGRCTAQLERAAPELNALDGRLGDGDLGATLEKCSANIQKALEAPPADLGAVFKACAVACTKASGSSLGTLLAVAFLTAAKEAAGKSEIAWEELPGLLGAVIAAMSARGGAKLGDKTVLDGIEAVRAAIVGIGDPALQHAAALTAVDVCLTRFRGEPNRIGRARMFGERSRGLDDPGMVAFRHMVVGLAAPETA